MAQKEKEKKDFEWPYKVSAIFICHLCITLMLPIKVKIVAHLTVFL